MTELCARQPTLPQSGPAWGRLTGRIWAEPPPPTAVWANGEGEMKPLRREPAALLCLSAAIAGLLWFVWLCSAAHAEAAYSFDTTPGRLPKTVVPVNYTIELAPDAKELTVAGNEVIDVEVREP